MAEWIAEAALAVLTPRHLMIFEFGSGASACGDRTLQKAVGIFDKQLDAGARDAEPFRAVLRRVSRVDLVEENGAPSTSRPATPPGFRSSVALSACLYQATAASASGTISITEMDADSCWPSVTVVSIRRLVPSVSGSVSRIRASGPFRQWQTQMERMAPPSTGIMAPVM